jgi:predicted nucleic acid-binding protein
LAVLDTNVVLALYWFRDDRLRPLAAALEGAQIEWVATTAMRQELAHVLELGHLPSGKPGVADPLTAFDSLALQVQTPQALRPWPRCTDEEDQQFIDLAMGARAAWLLTRDRAVLKLRRKVLALSGCQVLRPEEWRSCALQGPRAASPC